MGPLVGLLPYGCPGSHGLEALNGLRPSHERGGDALSVTDMTRVDQGEGKHTDIFTHLVQWWITRAVLETSKCNQPDQCKGHGSDDKGLSCFRLADFLSGAPEISRHFEDYERSSLNGFTLKTSKYFRDSTVVQIKCQSYMIHHLFSFPIYLKLLLFKINKCWFS